jgi:hypothetical protein
VTSLSDITASIFLPTSMSAIKLMVIISALPEESFRPVTPICFGIVSLSQILRSAIRLLPLFLPLLGQQPFLTDDADVAPVRHFHLELLSDYSWLHSSSYPAIRQNTSRFQLTFGPSPNLEIGVGGPLLAIFNAQDSATPKAFGFGDVNLQSKYRVRSEREGSRSGIADFWLNGLGFTGSSSFTFQASDRWLIGTEVAGATTHQYDLGKALLQVSSAPNTP